MLNAPRSEYVDTIVSPVTGSTRYLAALNLGTSTPVAIPISALSNNLAGVYLYIKLFFTLPSAIVSDRITALCLLPRH